MAMFLMSTAYCCVPIALLVSSVGGGERAAGSESDVNKDKEKDLELSLYSFTCIAWGKKILNCFYF
jgi:hypothetical protein